MYRQHMLYEDYVEEVERIYKIERREVYYSFIIPNFIQPLLTKSEQLVGVWDNKGYKDDTEEPLHERKNYADSHSLQDFIIVPEQYDYTHTTKPYVSIEMKRPDLENYKGLDLQNNKQQIEAELKYCDFIILTDCVTWMFLKKEKLVKKICLIQEGKWLQMERRNSNNERMENIYTKEPEKWEDLINTIRKFVEEARNQSKEGVYKNNR